LTTVTPGASSTTARFFPSIEASTSLRTAQSTKFFNGGSVSQKSYPKTLLNMAANDNEDFLGEEKSQETAKK